MNNITSKKLLDEMEMLIQGYIDEAKEHNRKPTRDEIIDTITNRLEILLKIESENNDRLLIISGIALGIAIVLGIDEKLKIIE